MENTRLDVELDSPTNTLSLRVGDQLITLSRATASLLALRLQSGIDMQLEREDALYRLAKEREALGL